jgi:hypothetical protein
MLTMKMKTIMKMDQALIPMSRGTRQRNTELLRVAEHC